MPVRTAKRGNKWAVVDDKGKVHGTHASKEKAAEQVTAMNIRMGHVPGRVPRKQTSARKRKKG